MKQIAIIGTYFKHYKVAQEYVQRNNKQFKGAYILETTEGFLVVSKTQLKAVEKNLTRVLNNI